MSLYPIKFTPILKEKVWGGTKLNEILHKNSCFQNTGESWEISGVKENISVVENGKLKGKSLKEIISEFKDELVGNKVYNTYGEDFPLLFKFIDAQSNLSVQLHPNDELAKKRHNSFGKTEMWYIVQADKGAKLNLGFKESLKPDTYLEFLKNDRITELLNFEEVSKGDSFIINAGLVHAIGKGVLLAEIQQTSDITYRIYDWNRKDLDGKKRELHTDLALEAINFKKKENPKLNYKSVPNVSSQIFSSQYFTTNFLRVKGEVIKNYNCIDSFVVYMCVEGKARVYVNSKSERLEKGESLLIPAAVNEVKIKAETANILEIYC